MSAGYVKLWRKTLDSGLLQMPNTLALFLYMLMQATHKPRKYGMENLDPGQFVSGRKKLASVLEQSEQEIRTSLEKLVTLEILTIKSTNKYSVYTIVNYEKYQFPDEETTSNLTNKQPTSNQQATTKQECKNVRKEEVVFNPSGYLSSMGVSSEVIADWLDLRKAKKAKPSKTAIDAIAKEAVKARLPLEDVLRLMCQNGWQGFNHSWIKDKDNGYVSRLDKLAETGNALTGGRIQPLQTERLIGSGSTVRGSGDLQKDALALWNTV